MPPRERRRYMIVKRSENAPDVVNGRKFGTHDAMIVHDKGEARAIDQRYGLAARGHPEAQTVIVTPIADREQQRQHGYKVFFTVPEMPWKKKESEDAEEEETGIPPSDGGQAADAQDTKKRKRRRRGSVD